jgi:hypothetical protein
VFGGKTKTGTETTRLGRIVGNPLISLGFDPESLKKRTRIEGKAVSSKHLL